MTFCIPYSDYDPEIHDLVSEPSTDCTSCAASVPTPAGTKSQALLLSQQGSGVGVSVIFDNVLSPGFTRIAEIKDSRIPQSRVFNFDIDTSCVFVGNITLVFTFPLEIDEEFFSSISILRNGQDVTVLSGPYAPDFQNRRIYAISEGFSFWSIFTGRCGFDGGEFCQIPGSKSFFAYKCM